MITFTKYTVQKINQLKSISLHNSILFLCIGLLLQCGICWIVDLKANGYYSLCTDRPYLRAN